MNDISRRAFAVGAPLALAGCATGGGFSIGSGADPSSMYGTYAGERFPVPAIPYQEIDPRFYRQIVSYANNEKPGTIIVDPSRHFLYHTRNASTAVRYGVGVGRQGFAWSGVAHIQRKAEWPSWTPPEEMQLRDREAAKWGDGMPGGLNNPLGARAMYLYQGERDTEYRLHGTIEPLSIGKSMSSGCIRLLNQDVINLYSQTPIGTKVIVLGA
jgi:lipoprotein-anchoring transpeptidase ErfK/SrfK